MRQALISMTGPFWDTVVLCAITGIAAVGSMVSHPQEYRGVAPENMCFVAFRELPVGGEWMLSISLTLFAFATIIGWNVYGTCAVRYLWGEAGVRVYQVAYMFFAYLGAVLSMELVWGISDLLNSLMLCRICSACGCCEAKLPQTVEKGQIKHQKRNKN